MRAPTGFAASTASLYAEYLSCSRRYTAISSGPVLPRYTVLCNFSLLRLRVFCSSTVKNSGNLCQPQDGSIAFLCGRIFA